MDICVFTISDDQITAAILGAYKRGVKVRIISDNDKSGDRGSDIDYLKNNNLMIKLDNTAHHMHHKFAIVDNTALINGSFNWTRSASQYNEENIVISYEAKLLAEFSHLFNQLWDTL